MTEPWLKVALTGWPILKNHTKSDIWGKLRSMVWKDEPWGSMERRTRTPSSRPDTDPFPMSWLTSLVDNCATDMSAAVRPRAVRELRSPFPCVHGSQPSRPRPIITHPPPSVVWSQ